MMKLKFEDVMCKVTFYIDDLKFFKDEYNFTDEQQEECFGDKESFKAIYALIGSQKQPERYTLTDYSGNKININNLNGYQRGVILNDCRAYYVGEKYFDSASKPCGVVKIIEEKVFNERMDKYRAV